WTTNPGLALEEAGVLVRLGYSSYARELLTKFENDLQDQSQYWSTLFSLANALKDPMLLLKAAEREYKMAPDDVQVANHYAAALLINRQQPELAVKLTLRLLAEFPDSVAARVNHAFALLLNHRPLEAQALLMKIPQSGLNPDQAASLQLGLFQAHFDLGQ